MEIARDGVEGPPNVPEGDKLGVLSDVGTLDLVDYIEQRHLRAVIQPISILVVVEEAVLVPDSIDPLCLYVGCYVVIVLCDSGNVELI